MLFRVADYDIIALATDMQTFGQGQALVNSNAVFNIHISNLGYEYVVAAQVTDKKETCTVLITFDNNGNYDYGRCDCSASEVWAGACKHVCAVLFALQKENSNSRNRAISERVALDIINGVKDMALSQYETVKNNAAAGTVTLEPILHTCAHYDELYASAFLSLKIGSNRKYVIKDIGSFIEAMQNGSVVKYGKSLTLKHSKAVLDENSRQLYELVEEQFGAVSCFIGMHNNYYARVYNSLRYLPITGAAVDSFIDYCGVFPFETEIEGEINKVSVCEEPFPRLFRVKDENGGPVLCIPGDYTFTALNGIKYDYLITGSVVYKAPRRQTELIALITSEFSSFRIRELSFKKEKTEPFISYVLPLIKQYGLADTSEVDSKYGIKELEARVYLDYEDQTVTARTQFIYGENENAIYRDKAAEDAVINILTAYGFLYDKENDIYMQSDASSVYEFCKTGVEELRLMPKVKLLATDEFDKRSRPVEYKRSVFGIRIKGNLLEIAPASSEFSMRELMDIVDAYKAKKKFHPLKDGRLINLEDEAVVKDAELLDSLFLSKKDILENSVNLPLSRAMFINEIIDQSDPELENRFFNRDEAFFKVISDFTNKMQKTYAIPEAVNNILRGYQKDGFIWLSQLKSYGFGGILADDMGLGKTLQIISLMLSEKQNRNSKPSLVVAPTSLIFNWQRECKKFAPQLNTFVISKARDKQDEPDNGVYDVYITTYDLLKRDIAFFAKRDYNLVIADEAQNIKNPATQNAKAVKKLNAEARFALTGTPIENALSELWSILDFALPGYLYGYSKFYKEYEMPIAKQKDAEKTERLKRLIAPFILRRVKKDVLAEIPDKLETILYADMSKAQRKLYTAYLLKARGELDMQCDANMLKENRVKILTYLMRLRQICCHPGVFIDNYKGGSGKLLIILETIINCRDAGHRMLLFSQFTSVLEIVMRELDELCISYYYLDGKTPADKRAKMCESFNAGEGDIFLISLKAGGTGLNLTGADVVIHFDPWWNPAVTDQATDRAHRIGQEKIVQVFSAVAKDTIEERIMELQSKKRELANSIITEGASFISRLTDEELAGLFN